jgi:hypothetical protein
LQVAYFTNSGRRPAAIFNLGTRGVASDKRRLCSAPIDPTKDREGQGTASGQKAPGGFRGFSSRNRKNPFLPFSNALCGVAPAQRRNRKRSVPPSRFARRRTDVSSSRVPSCRRGGVFRAAREVDRDFISSLPAWEQGFHNPCPRLPAMVVNRGSPPVHHHRLPPPASHTALASAGAVREVRDSPDPTSVGPGVKGSSSSGARSSTRRPFICTPPDVFHDGLVCVWAWGQGFISDPLCRHRNKGFTIPAPDCPPWS